MKTILLLGAPGSGKGSICSFLTNHYDFISLSTGRIFRNLINDNSSPLGDELKNILTKGEYVSDELTNKIVYEHLVQLYKDNPNARLVLDGYPRTIKQAQFLDQHFNLDKVVLLECPKEQILFRLSNRLVCKENDHPYHLVNKKPKLQGVCDIDQSLLYKRKDDQQDTILKRYDLYLKEVSPLIDYYQNKMLLTKIDASDQLSKVYDAFIKILKVG